MADFGDAFADGDVGQGGAAFARTLFAANSSPNLPNNVVFADQASGRCIGTLWLTVCTLATSLVRPARPGTPATTLVTLLGMVMSVRLLQPWNAYISDADGAIGNETSVRLLQS